MRRGGSKRGGSKRGGSRGKQGGSLLSELAVPGGLLVLNQLLKKRNKTKKNKRLTKRTLKLKKGKANRKSKRR
tara:strand:+ start:384 stop:602 length:219 start_codon:yes stop_codon:yes gene_type:complete